MRAGPLLLCAAMLWAGGPAAATSPQAEPGIRDAAALCASGAWDGATFAQHGYKPGAHFSLQARGQRVQQFEGSEGQASISLHSSFILYVACSAGIDLGAPEDFAPTRDMLVRELGLVQTQLDGQRLSANAAAFIKEYEIDAGGEIYSHGDHLVVIRLRQFNGRNRMSVFVIRLEKDG